MVWFISDIEAPTDGDITEITEEDDEGSICFFDEVYVFGGWPCMCFGNGVAGHCCVGPIGFEIMMAEFDIVGRPWEVAWDFADHIEEPG